MGQIVIYLVAEGLRYQVDGGMGHLGHIVTRQVVGGLRNGRRAGRGFMGHMGQLSRELKSLYPLCHVGDTAHGAGDGAGADGRLPVRLYSIFIFYKQTSNT